jgi:hypothetical protein
MSAAAANAAHQFYDKPKSALAVPAHASTRVARIAAQRWRDATACRRQFSSRWRTG